VHLKIRLIFNYLFQIEVNGLITFDYTTSNGVPIVFPLGGNDNAIAAYLIDIDQVCSSSRLTGDVYYRFSNGEYQIVLSHLSSEVHNLNESKRNWLSENSLLFTSSTSEHIKYRAYYIIRTYRNNKNDYKFTLIIQSYKTTLM
jgi:hypothetical protein